MSRDAPWFAALLTLAVIWAASMLDVAHQRGVQRDRADSLCAYVLKSGTASDTLLMHRRFGCNTEGSR